MTKKLVSMFALVLCLGWAGAALGGPPGLDDIEFWVGAGSNRAGFVIDWNDGPSPQALAWGYRWDGQATGWDMLTAIVGQTDIYTYDEHGEVDSITTITGADPHLTARMTDFGWGTMVDGFAYESDDLSHPPTTTDWWSYWTSEDGVVWDSAMVGMTDRILADGDWDGWGFELNNTSWDAANPPENPAPAPSAGSPPVPEPAGLAGLGLALTAILRGRRRRA